MSMKACEQDCLGPQAPWSHSCWVKGHGQTVPWGTLSHTQAPGQAWHPLGKAEGSHAEKGSGR